MIPLVFAPPVIVTRFLCAVGGARQVIDLGADFAEKIVWFQVINPGQTIDVVFDARSGVSAVSEGYRVRAKGLQVLVSKATRYATVWTLQGTPVQAAVYRIGQTELHT